MTSKYNTTDLDPANTFDRHVFHRDQFAHYLRWTHVLKEARIGDRVVDFGCGKGELLEVLYRNRFKPESYVGLDIRSKTIHELNERYEKLPFPVSFLDRDICDEAFFDEFSGFKANRVCSFEVAEHVGKQNISRFLKNFKACGGEDAKYYLSTPNYDSTVGAAGNHTYDSGDGRGVAVQEWDHFELQEHIEEAGFEILHKFGTFASQRDYVGTLNEWQKKMFSAVSEYYDSNLVANIMAPIIEPELARNCLWELIARND